MAAPVTAILAYDERFYEQLPKLFPHNPGMRDLFANSPELAETTAFRNGSFQGGYFILAARSLGLDCGPMSGFDNAKVDEEFFPPGATPQGCGPRSCRSAASARTSSATSATATPPASSPAAHGWRSRRRVSCCSRREERHGRQPRRVLGARKGELRERYPRQHRNARRRRRRPRLPAGGARAVAGGPVLHGCGGRPAGHEEMAGRLAAAGSLRAAAEPLLPGGAAGGV